MKKGIIIILLGSIGFGLTVFFLFFYDTSNIQNPVRIQDQKKQEIINKYTVINKNQKKDSYNSLDIALPKRLYNDNFIDLQQQITKNFTGLTINYNKIPDLTLYKTVIQKNSFPNIDLFLIPYEWIYYLGDTTIDLEEPIGNFFDPMLNNLINNNHFVPFALDPLVTWTRNDSLDVGLQSLIQYYSFREGNIHTTPLLRSENDGILEVFLQYAKLNKNYSILESIKNLYRINIKRNYTTEAQNNSINSLSEKNKDCSHTPYLCLLAYGLGTTKYGYLSDKIILKKILPNTKVIPKLFPYYKQGYPVRVRGFAVNKNSKKKEEIKIFLQQFIRNYHYTTKSVIPAIMGKSYYEQLFDDELTFLIGLKDERYPITYNNIDTQEFLTLIKEGKSLKDYWRKLIKAK